MSGVRGHHAGAHIIADVDVDHWRHQQNFEQAIDAMLTIADCSRTVTLDFSASNPSELTNALFKARSLLTVVTDFAAALESAAEDVELGGDTGEG